MNQNSIEQNKYQAQIFANRLSKKYRILRKWARKERITCYRLYDRDIPEVPVAVDLYEFLPENMDSKIEAARFLSEEEAKISANDLNVMAEKTSRMYVHLYLYERPYEKDEKDEEVWLEEISRACAKVIGIDESHVIKKLRKKQKGESQYEKIEAKNGRDIEGYVQECGQLFKVNLTRYLDTGLFLDHRPLRNAVRSSCAGKSVLNLFCYTASFSVYAAEGKARRIESVDLSNTYIDWAKFNFALNDFDPEDRKFVFTRSDVIEFLEQQGEKAAGEKSNLFDIIILDPPTFSNSKNTKSTIDINYDWPELVKSCIKLLTAGGILYFSTNSHRLRFNEEEIYGESIKKDDLLVSDITDKTVPEDFKSTKSHKCWKIVKKQIPQGS